jgi:2-polyprenyl-3-methyl-5-hydroxy-6-metoxy-1,4-benzoquinol methylase
VRIAAARNDLPEDLMLVDQKTYPDLSALLELELSAWPEHAPYLKKSIDGRDPELMSFSDKLSKLVLRLAATIDGGAAALAADYRFLCEKIVLPEELHFRRHGRYRLEKFEDALATVYANTAFMTRYMNGLLMSDVLWVNHCRGLQHYATRFLPSLRPGAHLLEIGPGHGLLLYLASEASNVGKISAWDVSAASLKMSAHALDVLGAKRPVTFESRNIFDPSIMSKENEGLFDAVVLSEVLEHLEHPEQAIKVLLHLCKPGGRVWINVPANSPAPDHLYLVNEPAEAERLVQSVGFNVVDAAHFPMTGVTLERAIKQKLTITCIVAAEKPA